MESEVTKLAVEDYVVFGVMLAISLAIGIFYAIRDRSVADGVQNYLLASRQMNYIPVGFSISVSFLSAVTILGIPAEVYYFGTMYLWFLAGIVWSPPIVTEIFIETFYTLKVTSVFEYIELRFDRGTRLFSTAIYIVQSIMYIGIMIYAPSLALDSVTDFNVWAAVSITGVVCTLYTSIGGLKAVIWTDVFQGIILTIVTLVTLITTSNAVGGFGKVWDISVKGGRVDFLRFDTDPRIRQTFWSTFVGLGFLWLTMFGTNQSQVQRYCSCKSKADAKKGLIFGVVLSTLLALIIGLTGLVVYAYFETCDPLLTRKIDAPDQILPYMILQTYANTPGMSGLFIAGLYAGCMSTVSTGINALACVTLKDFIQPYVDCSPNVQSWISKGLVLLYGALCVGFAFLSSILGGVVQASLSLLGLVGGPLFGLFSLGMLFPFVHSVAANLSVVFGLALNLWIYIGSTVYPPPTEFTRPKSLNTSGCLASFDNSSVATTTIAFLTSSTSNVTEISVPNDIPSSVPAIANLYHVSFGYYTAIGFAATLFLGLLFSLMPSSFFGQEKKKVDPRLLVHPFDHKWLRWLPSSFRSAMRCGVEEKVVDEELSGVAVNKKNQVTSFSKSKEKSAKRKQENGEMNAAYVSNENWYRPTEL